MAGVRVPRGVQPEQLGGHLQQGFLHPLLGPQPARAAELVERDLRRIAAGELLDEPHPAHRQVDLVPPGVLEDQEVPGDALHLHLRQPGVAADAEVGVDDEVAFLQLAEGRAEGLVACAAPSPADGPGRRRSPRR